jgi:uncharacterized protein (TIGR02246 family)
VSAHDEDIQAIQQLLGRLVTAWNAGDAAGYAALFTQDADYITFFGVNMPGRPAIEEGHRALFSGPGHGSRLAWTAPPKTRFLRPDVAVAVAAGTLSPHAGLLLRQSHESAITLVLAREPAGWQIASFQNTRRTPVPVDPGRRPPGDSGEEPG